MNIEEKIKELDLTLLLKDSFNIEGPLLKVECDIDVNLGLDWVNNCILKKITKRGTEFYCAFNQKENSLTLEFFTKIPGEDRIIFVPRIIYSTFVDMCWLYSEGTTKESIEEVATAIRKDGEYIYKAGDLTWVLPSKFTDDLVEMIHTINPDFMSGLMQDAIVYGPFKMGSYIK